MATITDITSFREAQQTLKKADQQTLVIFDVDYVLTQPSDPALQMLSIKSYKGDWKTLLENLTPLENDLLNTLVALDGKSDLVEKDILATLQSLQKADIKVIALTAILTGSLEKIDISSHRFHTLQSLGIDFSSSFPTIPAHSFTTLPSSKGHFPSWENGIIYANGDAQHKSKGQVLKAFLEIVEKKTGWRPQKILFFDDRVHNLEDVQEMCATYKPTIVFKGFLYKGAAAFPKYLPPKDAFLRQWQTLVSKAKALAKDPLHE